MARFVLDASVAAAWILPDENNQKVDALIATIEWGCLVPTIFWHEIRNILVMAERRKRISPMELVGAMRRLRRLPLEDVSSADDDVILALCSRHQLSAYDAAYLALAKMADLPLATLDRKLSVAASENGAGLCFQPNE